MVISSFQLPCSVCVCVMCLRRVLALEETLKCWNWRLRCPGSDPSPASQQADGIQVVRLRVDGVEVEGVVGTMKWRVTSLLLSNPFRTGVEGRVKWFLFGRLNCLFSEPAEFRPPLRQRHDYGGYGCHFSLCGSSPTIVLNIRSSSFHHTLSVASSLTCRGIIYSPCRRLTDVKMILCPGKHVRDTDLVWEFKSAWAFFSWLVKHLKRPIRNNDPPCRIEYAPRWFGAISLPWSHASSQVAGY